MKPSPYLRLSFVLLTASLSAADNAVETPFARGERITALLAKESLGPLHLNQPEKEVIQLLGQPRKRGPMIHTEADGLDAQGWFYPAVGLTLKMVSSTGKSGPKFLTAIDAKTKCPYATQHSIRIGSAQSAVQKAYAGTEELPRKDFHGSGDASFVVGSIYSGILFEFTGGQVSRIFFGAVWECRTIPSVGNRG